MSAPDLEVIKDIPGYKVILKAVLKSQIQQLVEQLASHTDEESVILTASVSDGTLCHLGSDSGKNFLEDHEDIKSQFLGFCLKRHHKKKQQDKEKAEAAAAARNMPTTPTRYGGPGPRPGYGRSPRFSSPRHQGIHPIALTRASPGSHIRSPRHEPYPHARPPRRPSLNFEQGRAGPGPGLMPNMGPGPGAMRLPLSNKIDGQVIKIEADDPDDSESKQTVSDPNNQTMSGAPGVTSSSPPSSPSHQNPPEESSIPQMKTEEEDARSDTSSSTIPNEVPDLKFSDSAPPEGLSLDSDLSNLISTENNSGGDSSNIQQPTTPQTSGSAPPTPGSSSGLDPNINVKVEAITESEMELEITGVEPGRMPVIGSGPQDNWDVPGGMGYDPSGAMGSQGDMQGSEQGYSMANQTYLDNTNLQGLMAQFLDNEKQGSYTSGVMDTSTWFDRDRKYTRMSSPSTAASVFTCGVCKKEFLSKWYLDRHAVTHTGIKPFKCTHCDYCCSRKDNLKIHIWNLHLKK